jgi:hypothetical protein
MAKRREHLCQRSPVMRVFAARYVVQRGAIDIPLFQELF